MQEKQNWLLVCNNLIKILSQWIKKISWRLRKVETKQREKKSQANFIYEMRELMYFQCKECSHMEYCNKYNYICNMYIIYYNTHNPH